MKSFFTAVIVIILFFMAFLFGSRNEQLVTINYFLAQGEYRLPFVLAIVFFAGFAISLVLFMFYIFRLKLQLRQCKKKIKRLEGANTPAKDA